MTSQCHGNLLEGSTPFSAPANADRLSEVARKTLGETDDLKEMCLKQLKDLIKDNHVSCVTRDDFLLSFLRTRKFDVHRSFQTIQNYAKQRAVQHNRILKLQPEFLKSILRRNMCGFLPYRDSEERLIFFAVIRLWNTDVCSDEEIVRVIVLLLYYLAHEESTQVNGFTVILDSAQIPWTTLPYALKHAKNIASLLFGALPIRYHAVHFLNETAVIRLFIRLVDPLLPKKLKSRFHFHGKSRDVLLKHLSPEILPDSFGGSLGPINSDHLTQELLDFLGKLKDEQKYFLPQNS